MRLYGYTAPAPPGLNHVFFNFITCTWKSLDAVLSLWKKGTSENIMDGWKHREEVLGVKPN
ncbi:hypothetical protein CFP56_032121 [Quercus suber]|uniref:Uncharacterized protein n=1 Tax=Quercus suber TaxID=58331 RepID=A0AAW0JHL6_QUESU